MILSNKQKKALAIITSSSFLLNNFGILGSKNLVKASSYDKSKTMIEELNKDIVEKSNIEFDTMRFVNHEPMYIINPEEENINYEEFNDEMINEDGMDYPLNIVGELPLDFTSTEDMISFYSKVFELDENVISNTINNIIEQDSDAFYENNTINGIEYNSREEAILRTVRDIYTNSSNYNLDRDEIHTEYELNDLSPEEFIYKFSHVIGINPNIALAVAYSESGRSLSSHNFLTNYNVAGLHPRQGYNRPTTREGYVIYQNMADGLLDFVIILHDNFYVTEEDGIDRINTMSRSYSEVPSHWRNLVSSNYYNLVNNGYDNVYESNNPDREFVYSLILENE